MWLVCCRGSAFTTSVALPTSLRRTCEVWVQKEGYTKERQGYGSLAIFCILYRTCPAVLRPSHTYYHPSQGGEKMPCVVRINGGVLFARFNLPRRGRVHCVLYLKLWLLRLAYRSRVSMHSLSGLPEQRTAKWMDEAERIPSPQTQAIPLIPECTHLRFPVELHDSRLRWSRKWMSPLLASPRLGLPHPRHPPLRLLSQDCGTVEAIKRPSSTELFLHIHLVARFSCPAVCGRGSRRFGYPEWLLRVADPSVVLRRVWDLNGRFCRGGYLELLLLEGLVVALGW